MRNVTRKRGAGRTGTVGAPAPATGAGPASESPESAPTSAPEPAAEAAPLRPALFARMDADAARLELLLGQLRLPGVRAAWPRIATLSDKEGWPAARFLAALLEHECADRGRRRIERHLLDARLPYGKTLATFDFTAVPSLSKAHVHALTQSLDWIETGANVLIFGGPGTGKSHLAAAVGLALVEAGRRVLFTRTNDLVQRLQRARRELGLQAAIEKLDRYDLLILDDFAYVNKDQAETSVLFELIAARYEARSLMLTANKPFAEWNALFEDVAMTLATVDRLVHHGVILEMNVESYRRREAMARKARGKPPSLASARNTPLDPAEVAPEPSAD